MASHWPSWVGQTIDGVFPLIRFIGTGTRSAVFETICRDGGTQRAAIKFIPATAEDAQEILENWQAASALSHPSLLQILAGGDSQIGDQEYIYVVTELADDSLANVLPDRKLSPQETRDMLGPILNALKYLHSKGFVHGHLSPSNVMAVGDQLKIPVENAMQDGEEADDVAGIGRLLVEVLPQPLTAPFDEIAEGCLESNPSERWTLGHIEAELKSQPRKHGRSATASKAFAAGADGNEVSTKREINPLLWIGGGGMGLLVILVLVLWLGSDAFRLENFTSSRESTAAKTSSAPTTNDGKPAPKAEPLKQGSASKATDSASDEKSNSDDSALPKLGRLIPSSGIVKRVLPDVPRQGRETINGRVTMNVEIEVDPEGNVTKATMLPPPASKYFTKYALDAAREWKFAPEDSPRTLMLRFLLRRTETEVSVGERVAN